MNQFNKYKGQLERLSFAWESAIKFDEMLNSMWCSYSFEKGETIWHELSKEIPEPYKTKISIEVGHVYSGHGIKQARLALKDEINTYIEYLLKECRA